MENLFLPKIDFSESPELNMSGSSYWALKNPWFQRGYYVPDFLSPTECMEVKKLGNAFPIDQSSTGGGGFTGFNDIRKSYNSWIFPCEISSWFFQKLDKIIKEVNAMSFEYDLHSIENIQYTVYNEEYKGMYGKHVDMGGPANTPDSHRKLSFSIQLTDPVEYEGGDLLLYHDGETPEIAPKGQGMIAFFPSYTIHEVTPVTKGERISAVSWIHGPRFK